jgi:seryl-tRNA synthetase
MIDIQLLRKDLDTVITKLQSRKKPQDFLDIQAFQTLEQERKNIQLQTEQQQARRNQLSKQVGLLKAQGEDTQDIMLEVSSLKKQLDLSAARYTQVQTQLQAILLGLPNLPHKSVPIGQTEQANQELRRWGSPKAFDFVVKDHVDLGLPLGLDFAMGSKLAGARFVFMYGVVARLHRALSQLMLDTHIHEHQYTECYTPYIVHADILQGTGQLPKFAEDLFTVQKGGQDETPLGQQTYLIPTAEVTLTHFAKDALLEESKLPIKLVAHTACFRSEAGSYGRDTRGMVRQHQFDKVEMVQIVHPDHSYLALEAMVNHAENILQKLDLPYRVVSLCTGDMGFSAAKTYDLEVWLPGQNTYREISSVSNCEAFQARRLQGRFKHKDTGKNDWLHTLNGSGLAVGRTLVAVLENYQNVDGSITIPDALRPYLGGIEKIG